MSAARLPYYQQQTSDQRRRSSSRGRHSSKRRSVERRRHSRSRSRSRSVEQRQQQRRRHSREHDRDRDRDRHRRHHHRDSRDRSWERERERDRERDRDSRDYGRRSSNHYQHDTRSRSRSATPPGTTFSASASASSSAARRQLHQQQQQQQQQLLQPQQGIGHNKHKQMTDPRMLPTSVPGKKDNAMSAVGAYYNLDTDEPFDKERIHREIEEKLRETLAREGKVYPPPKAEPSHPVFANDGSFMELFKKMQEEQQRPQHHHQHQQHQQHQQQQQQQHQHQRQLDAATAAAAAAAAAASAAIMMSDQPQHHHHQQQQHPQHPDVASPFGILPAIAVGAASSAAAPYIAAAAAGKSAPPPPMVGRRRGGKILKTGVVAKLKTPNERDVDPKDFWSLYLAEVNKYKSNACDTDNGKRPLVNDKSSADIMSAYKMETAPFDPRFPNQNVTRYCYQSYVDFHRCQKKRGEDFAPCNYFKKVYKTMCPNAWVEKWDDQRESGTFPGRI